MSVLLRQSRKFANLTPCQRWRKLICTYPQRCYSSVATEAQEKYTAGQKIHGYTVQDVTPIPEFSFTAIQLTHDNTGAKHLHVTRDDSNNVFGVAFRTTPMDDTGVPHILEHTALCGSERFPVRDPFFKMLTRSLNTFMNAFTSSDWTMYPFSTQNPQDYRNLMSVYLDAAFFPKLRELDFMQEGWRLEHENPNDPSSPIVFKGVVYNEMKGVFSTGANLYSQKCQNLLSPSHTYGTVYGGEPSAIVDLTWEELRRFHATHYHPSNARFYTYGNFPLEDHLERISDKVLAKFSRIDPNTAVPTEPRWESPREATMLCMPDPMAPDQNKQSTVSVSYLLADVTDAYESFALSFVSSLLVNGEKSPFYRSLIEANIGSDYSPVIGYSGDTKDASFSVGLQGIHGDDVDKVKVIIDETLNKVVSEGFEAEQIEALLHRIELDLKHQSDKFGLYLGIGMLPAWTHDGDPAVLLQVNKMVDKLKGNMAENPGYLQEQVAKYFKNNQHRLTLAMHPDESFESERQKKEATQLSRKVAALSGDQKQRVYDKGVELLAEQMKEPDLSCLPSLKVTDINPRGEKTEVVTVNLDGTKLQLSSQPTNGLTYFRAVSDISTLRADLLPYVPLFCNVVTKMGAGEWDYREFSQQIDLACGGLNASPHVIGHHTTPGVMEQGIMLSSHCLDRNTDRMYQLWQEIFHRLDLSDMDRLTTLIMMTASELANSITGSGHRYAMMHSASSLNPVAALYEQMDGLSQVSLMKSIAESSDLSPVLDFLKSIANHVLSSQNIRCAINSTPDSTDAAQNSTEQFLKNILKEKSETLREDFFNKVTGFEPKTSLTHYELPFQVNYLGKSFPTVPYTHEHFASLRILASMMGSKHLHREIREKGGAYGGGAVGSSPGQFSFFSYRDPNSERTLNAFDGAVEWACEGNFTQQDIDESKLAVFAQVDSPIPPGSKGLREFVHHISYDTYQDHRQQLFKVNKDSLVNVAKTYLKGSSLHSVSLLGPENSLSKDDSRWNVIRQ